MRWRFTNWQSGIAAIALYLSLLGASFGDDLPAIRLNPAWERSCEEIAGGKLFHLGRDERENLASKVLEGRELTAPERNLLLDELNFARAGFESLDRARESSLPPSVESMDLDSAITLVQSQNHLQQVEWPIRRWLAYRLLRPTIANLETNDQGQSLQVPQPGEIAEGLLRYLTQKFAFSGELVGTSTSASGQNYYAMSLRPFPNGPTIALNPGEVLDEKQIFHVLNAAFLGHSYYSFSAMPVLAWNTNNLGELAQLLADAGWQFLQHDRLELFLFSDPRTGMYVWISQKEDFAAPFAPETQTRLFNAFARANSLVLAPNQTVLPQISSLLLVPPTRARN